MSSNFNPNPGIPMQPQAQAKKIKPWVWILAGCGTLLVLSIVVIIGAVTFGIYKFNNSEFAKNPAMAAAKFALSQNPDIEVISTDNETSTFTIKDKRTGKIITMNANEIGKGKISFSEDGKEAVTIQTNNEGSTGNIEVKSDKGTMKLGETSVNLPDWIPAYPGSSPTGNFSMEGDEGTTNSFSFTTTDSVEDVINFYDKSLKDAGLKVTKGSYQQDGKTSGYVAGSDADSKRTASIGVATNANETQVSVSFVIKK
jgi:hypothetical protein